jgi:inhibitor of cysteine peptidase
MIVIVVLLLAAMLSSCAGLQSLIGLGPKPTESGPPLSPPAQSDSATPASQSGTESPSASVSISPTPEPAESPEASAAAPSPVAAITSEKFDYTSDYIETSVVLPRVTGLADAGAQDKVNAVFEAYMASVKKDNMTSEAESKQLAEDNQSAVNPYQIAVSFSVPYNRDGILCVLVSDYRYLGGAHGGELWVSHTFDLKTGKELRLGDLMKSGSGYRKYISGVIRGEIDRRTADDELVEIATFADIGDKPAFLLTASSVVFYFQEYEYFPYAAGIQQFEIPYAELSDMLKPDYTGLELKTVPLRPAVKNTLQAGDIGEVTLDGNMSTGYMWTCDISDTGVLELAAQDMQSSDKTGVVGGGETFYWYFRALKPGTATVTFDYIRAWDDGATPEPGDSVRVTVTVR